MKGKKKIILTVLASAVAASLLTLASLYFLLGLNHYKVGETLRLLGAMRFIESHYVDQVDDTKLIDGAIAGMVKSLDDPHSLYLDQDMYKKLKDHTEGSFGGIGVVMSFNEHKVQVISVLEGTPGQAAGLEEGDGVLHPHLKNGFKTENEQYECYRIGNTEGGGAGFGCRSEDGATLGTDAAGSSG